MPTFRTDRDDCPLDSCAAEPAIALITTDPTKLTTQNFVHERVCLKPTLHEGEPATYIVYHEEIDPPEPDPQPSDDDHETDPDDEPPEPPEDPDPAEADPDAPAAPDPDDLDADEQTVYRIVSENASPTVTQAAVGGQCLNADIAPSETDAILDDLADRGYLVETEDAVYRPA